LLFGGRWLRLVVPCLLAVAFVVALVLARHHIGGGEPTGFTYDTSAAMAGRALVYLVAFANALAWQPVLTDMPGRLDALARTAWAPLVAAALLLLALVAPWPRRGGALAERCNRAGGWRSSNA